MIFEMAKLEIKPGMESAFEKGAWRRQLRFFKGREGAMVCNC